ncbi:MAG: tetraacyldisaccharide 4'-kinase, partial [Flavobacterium sp.]|nr:tetraacyldisaccharide 4'-kinase [Flavobacterium sp.]
YMYSENGKVKISELNEEKVLVAGIAKPDLFFDFLGNQNDDKITFPDHHDFVKDDITKILAIANDKKIITTEKDYVRLKGKLPSNQLYYLPIQSQFMEKETYFNTKILDYVGESTRNS